MPGADDPDPDLLLALVRADPDTRGLLPWAEAAWRLAADDALTFPIRGPEDVEPLFAEAIANGDLSDTDVEFISGCIPASVFPVRDFRQFLDRALLVVEIVHRLQDPEEPPKKW
ncbi:hypothetical protein [Actinomycetospora aeridis]|uniref:Uncharacterized protein n=1 Tax=Actinomycetospora aeridis TaxID=3129231 RepID=A0ABU8N5N3_9PSEU